MRKSIKLNVEFESINKMNIFPIRLAEKKEKLLKDNKILQ